MKKVIVSVCLMLGALIVPFSNVSYNAHAAVKSIEAISIEMSDDILIAKSDNPNDPLTLLQVYNRANQLLMQTACGGTKCDMNLSSLPAGTYIAKAYTVSTHASKIIYVN